MTVILKRAGGGRDILINCSKITFLCNFRFLLFSSVISGIGPPKKTFVGTPPPNSCPICGIQLAPSDLETHFSAELSRLAKMTSPAERLELRRTLSVDMHAMQSTLQGRTSRWEVSCLNHLDSDFKIAFFIKFVNFPCHPCVTDVQEYPQQAPGPPPG